MTNSPYSKPNILFILTDQQSASMMSCTGNKYLSTPAMDSLAKEGVRFERAYCSDPICVPSRFSIFTGKYPSEAGFRGNNPAQENAFVPESIYKHGMGWELKKAGYEVAYGGKQHFPLFKAEDIGFDVISKDERDILAQDCVNFISQKRELPFFLVASFINPHDICHMAIRDNAREGEIEKLWLDNWIKNDALEIKDLEWALQMPEGMDEDTFFNTVCPPLPDNFEVQENEPESVRTHQAERPFKKRAREIYTERQWRLHRWAYCKLTEKVDAQIGQVLKALRDIGQVENTVVIFTSDHGDMDAAHRMEHKELLYEEACRIPLIISQPGITSAGEVNRDNLVSNGLDIITTIYDYAGINKPEDLKGRSLRKLSEGIRESEWRTELLIEGCNGKAIVTERYKYVSYDEGENKEQVYDLVNDPGESKNQMKD